MLTASWSVPWLSSLLLMVMTQLGEGGGLLKHIYIPTWTPAAFQLCLTVLFTASILVPGMALGAIYTGLAWAYLSSACGPGLPGPLPGSSSPGSLPLWCLIGPAFCRSGPGSYLGCTGLRTWVLAPPPRPAPAVVSLAWPTATAASIPSSAPCSLAAAASTLTAAAWAQLDPWHPPGRSSGEVTASPSSW